MESEGFRLAFSAISLELWFIMHLKDCSRAFKDGEECLKYLKRIWPIYHKTKHNHYSERRAYLGQAVARAEKLEKKYEGKVTSEFNNYTSVHQMIAFFRFLKG